MLLVSVPTLIKSSPTEAVKTLSNNPYPQNPYPIVVPYIKMAAAALLPSTAPPKTKTFVLHHQAPKLLQLKQSARLQRIHALKETQEKATPAAADEVTKKYGLEVGLWKIFSSKEEKEGSKMDQAKELLTKYGGAYLATSITLSIVSFTFCYLLVSAGIDIQALLAKVGIVTDETGGKVGTFALAYAAHKAASPIRFPPTVALTPIVASWMGKKQSDK